MINAVTRARLESLAEQYRGLAKNHPEAVREIALAEIPEAVYNSNAIENSTLTLIDTEDILLRDSITQALSVREVFEAKNLARVTEKLLEEPALPVSVDSILSFHGMLLEGIRDDWAGRFRAGKEWVRVGNHVGANPEFVEPLVRQLVADYNDSSDAFFLDRVAWFHAEFEIIHPFNDGNGRIGRVLINQQLSALGLPPVIIQNKGKRQSYYPSFNEYRVTGKYDGFTELLASLLAEAIYKRLTLISAPRIITVSAWAKNNGVAANSALNKAARGTIPAFRLRGKWMIAADFPA